MIEQTESLSSLLTVFINCFHQSPQNHSLSPNDSLCFTFIIVSRCSLKTDLILLLIIHFTWFHPGNTIPKSYLARLFGILWIVIDLVLCSFFTATFTRVLTLSSIKENLYLELRYVFYRGQLKLYSPYFG